MVQKNGQESELGVVKMTVIQGGVLSPTLFNIFVNDMSTCMVPIKQISYINNKQEESLVA
jgi:hypothetical protein